MGSHPGDDRRFGLPLGFAGRATAEEPKPMLMFVQIADDFKANPTTQTLPFARDTYFFRYCSYKSITTRIKFV
jgi:hypothetical protein